MLDMEDEDENAMQKVQFHWTISLGQMLQAGAIAVGLVVWLTTWGNNTNAAVDSVNNLKTDVRQQISELRTHIDTSVNSLQTEIAGLPDYAARLNVVEKHEATLDQSVGSINDQLRRLGDQSIQNRADIDNIMRASQLSLHRH